MHKPIIGILGVGKLGTALGRLSVAAGYETWLAGSGSVDKIALSVNILVPGACASTAKELVAAVDVVILALPLGKYKTIPNISGKIVLDAMNYWWEVDGNERIPFDKDDSSSEMVQRYLKDALVVKAFNHMGYHDIEYETKAVGESKRKAIAYAADEPNAVVEMIIDDFGFDALFLQGLKSGYLLEPGMDAFGANLSKTELKHTIERSILSD